MALCQERSWTKAEPNLPYILIPIPLRVLFPGGGVRYARRRVSNRRLALLAANWYPPLPHCWPAGSVSGSSSFLAAPVLRCGSIWTGVTASLQ